MVSHGPVAIVTGAARGIGYTVSDYLLREGFKVCLADINEKKGEESRAELQRKYSVDKVIFVECDVTSEDSFRGVFSKAQEEFGRIDVLVNNAGIFDEYDPERMVAINVMGPINGCQLAFKFMGTSNGGKGGVVVNVSSIGGVMVSPYAPAYCATKHAIVGLTRAYGNQHHLDQNGITFMAIGPFSVRTQMLQMARALKPISECITQKPIEPEFVAEGVLKLLKDKHNGSVLLALPEKFLYVDIQEELKKIIP